MIYIVGEEKYAGQQTADRGSVSMNAHDCTAAHGGMVQWGREAWKTLS